MKDIIEDFNRKLLNSKVPDPFPFVDPPRYWKAPIIVDAELYLDWFNTMLHNARSQGYCISFIVGDPGAGKTHFLCHINYLYYEAGKFDGIYSTYSAGEERITPEILWRDFFSNTDVVSRLNQILKPKEVESINFPHLGMKEAIITYLKDPLSVQRFESRKLRRLAEGISNLLYYKGAHMCMVIDNTDEYFRWLNSLRTKTSSEKNKDTFGVEPTEDDLSTFFGTLRNTATNMQAFLLLVACTQPAYTHIKNITVDRTHAGRIIYQSEILGPLTLGQAYELVNRYMDHWAKENRIELPIIEECLVETVNGEKLNIYPFSKVSIKEIHEITGQYARDIKMICNEAINEMKMKRETWIVKDENLAYAVEEANRRRPQIVPEFKVNEFKKRRVSWLRNTVARRLPELVKRSRAKHRTLTPDMMANIMDSYLKALGIEVVANIQHLPNWYNPAKVTDPTYMRLLKYVKGEGKEKNILCRYVLASKPPINNKKYRKVELRDLTDAISYVESALASHIILILLWSEISTHAIRRNHARAKDFLRYEPVIEEFSIDENLWNIIASVEEAEDENDQKDLVEHVDEYYLKLKKHLNLLIDNKIIPSEPYEEKLKKMRKEAAHHP